MTRDLSADNESASECFIMFGPLDYPLDVISEHKICPKFMSYVISPQGHLLLLTEILTMVVWCEVLTDPSC